MKSLRVLLSSVVVIAIVLATFLPSYAIGFVAEDIYESVFVVYSGSSLGSGFAIGQNCIITNAHVIASDKDVLIKTYSGEEFEAFVLGMDQKQDIAVLWVKGAQFAHLTIADEGLMNTGDDIYAIGAPKSMSYTLTKGVISAKERRIGLYEYIQIDAPVNEGNSGGPLLNEAGEVLGVNTLKMSDSEGIGLAIPMKTVIAYLATLNAELDEGGNVVGSIEPTDAAEDETESDYNEPETALNEEPHAFMTMVLAGLTALSVLGNVILSICLIYEKKRNLNIKYDPRERTDFDIEILE